MRYCPSCHRCFPEGVNFCLFDHTSTFQVDSLPLLIDGKYRLERLIAHGGMGSVYRALHVQLDRAVAIKILRAEFLSDPTIRERFNREARAAARLKHPNIVAVYDFGGLPSGSAYLVMELIEGRSLREELRMHASRGGQMRPERAAAILAQVCAGVEAAHRHGVIHRDLKPDNVMIESENGPERVLVLDFGIAKLKDRDQAMRFITDEETIVGTPNYISPEQCSGAPVDARSDVYSLGVMLYEMLTGQVPFPARNTSAVLLRHLHEAPAAPSRFRPELAGSLEHVVMRALQKSPERRFASAAQFAAALTGASGNGPRPASPRVYDEDETRERPIVSPPAAPAMLPAMAPAMVMDRAPSLLIEHRPRVGFLAAFSMLLLTAAGAAAYLGWDDWQALAVQLQPGKQSGVEPAPPPPVASPRVEAVQIREAGARPAPPPASPKNTPAYTGPTVAASGEPAERERKAVEAVYTGWAASAARGDWPVHLGYYADRVEYFRDGVIPRAKVEARKRRIFGGLTRYTLQFSDSPQVRVAGDQAEIAFDRRWWLCRARRCRDGQARGMLLLRKRERLWRIVSEKQIGKK
jgi:serine/threonine protein kinase/ketosteroid isomerase-like protein